MLQKPNRKKIDKQDGNIPRNIEQLIQKYDLEKLWSYIEKAVDYINKNEEKMNDYQNYSTEEQVVGKWTNGKILYRKTITDISVEASKTAGTYAYQYVKVGDNFEELFVKKVDFISNTNTTKQTLPIIYDTGNMIKFSAPDANYIMFSNNSTASGTATAIIEYTKTTD